MTTQNELKSRILAKCNELELSKSIKDVRKLKYDVLNIAYQKINNIVLDNWQHYVNIRIYELEKNLNFSIDDKILWLHNEIE